MNNKSSLTGKIIMVATALLWGLAGVCVKSVSWGTMSVIAVRSFLSAMLLFAVKGSFKVHFTRMNLLGAVFMTATGMLYVQSIKLTTAGTAIVLQYLAPILVFLFAIIFQHRKPKIYEILITLAVFGGIVLSFADNIDPSKTLGNILGLLSGVTFAGQIVAMSSEEADSRDSLLISSVMSFLIAFPFMFFDSNLVFDTKNIVWMLILGLFQYGLANVLFGIGIKKVDKVEGSLILTIEPIFNPIPVAIICHEKMGTLAIIGYIVVIFFVTLYGLMPVLTEKRKERKAENG